jgi:hypothetical protein
MKPSPLVGLDASPAGGDACRGFIDTVVAERLRYDGTAPEFPLRFSVSLQPEVADFDQIVENYADFAYNVAYRVMGNPDDAQDCVQDAFISAYRNLDKFRQDSKVSTWLLSDCR